MSDVALVFVHGFLGRPSSWDAVRDGLRLNPSDIALSLPGHGPTPWTPPQDTFDSAVDALTAKIPTVPPRWLVGYSMGARIALRMLVRHPERFVGATLIGCHPGLSSAEERHGRIIEDEGYAEKLMADGIERFVQEWEDRPLFATRRALPANVREAHRRRALDHTPNGASWAMRTLGLGRMPSCLESLPDMHLPLQLVAGSEDSKFQALAREMAAVIPQATLHVVAGSGHDVPTENPLAVAELLRAALEHA